LNFENYLKERIKLFNMQKINVECKNLLWASNSLGGETGEFQNIVKKIFRDEKGNPTKYREDMISEMGDVFWYWLFVLEILNIKPETVLDYNMNKLHKKYGI